MNSSSGGKKIHIAWILAMGVSIQGLIFGLYYNLASQTIVPITTSMNIPQGKFMLYMTVQFIAMAVSSTLAPNLMQRFRYTTLNKIAIVLVAGAALAFATAKNVYSFYIGGALYGIAMVYVSFLLAGILIPRFFAANHGLMISLVGLPSTLFGAILMPVIASVIQRPTFLGMESWRGIYVLFCIAALSLGLLNAFLLLKEDPGKEGRYVGKKAAAAAGPENAAVEPALEPSVDKAVAFKSAAFIVCVLTVFIWNLTGTGANYVVAFATLSKANEVAKFNLIGLVSSCQMIGGLVGGLILGRIDDKLGVRAGSLFVTVVGGLGVVLMLLFQGSPVLLLVGTFLFGCYMAVSTVHAPGLFRTLFGMRDYDQIYSRALGLGPWIAALSASIWGFLYDATGSYSAMLTALAVLCALTGIGCMIAQSLSKKLPRS